MAAQAVCNSVIYHTLCLIHKVLRLSHIYKTAGYDIRSGQQLVAVTLQGQDYNDDTVLCQVLAVTQYNVSDIAHTKTVYQDAAVLYMIHNLAGILADFHNITGRHNEHILLRNADRRCDGAVCYKMAVLTVYRKRKLRMQQGVDQLDLLLAGMAGYMGIFGEHLA